jgi:hypothetical protein
MNNVDSDNVKVRLLDWKQSFNPRCPSSRSDDLVWSDDDVLNLQHAKNILFVAADVIYNEKLTFDFFRCASQLMKPGEHLLLSMEKRYNFTIEDEDVVAHGYASFLEHVEADDDKKLHSFENPFTSSPVRFAGRQILLNFPQRIYNYERVPELELWDIQLLIDDSSRKRKFDDAMAIEEH